MWLDILMSFLKFKFRTTIGSHFWDLLQKVLQQVLESPSVSQKRELKRALEILGKKKNPPSFENGNNSRKERCWPKPHS